MCARQHKAGSLLPIREDTDGVPRGLAHTISVLKSTIKKMKYMGGGEGAGGVTRTAQHHCVVAT